MKCRLINPAKSNIGRIAQQKLEGINEKVIDELKLQQWRSTTNCLNWFKKPKKQNKNEVHAV